MLNDMHRDIIALSMVPDLGPRGILSLLEKVRDTEELFSANFLEWAPVLCSVRKSAEYLEELSYIENEGIQTVCYKDKVYPEALRNIYAPPPILYCKGALKEADAGAIAIVGSRRCSAYGFQMAEKVAFDLAKKGITIVSGMARGIDEAAHRGALKAGGRTIAVLGSGFRHIYPPGSKQLASLISEKGAVITEFQSGMEPLKSNFPRRNRIISGLAKGVVVVEAAKKSGALITVDFALNQGKEVFAVPGRADFHTSDGTNRLIQNGAKLVTGAEDILEELDIEPRNVKTGSVKTEAVRHLSDEQERVIKLLDKNTPLHIDEISGSAGIDSRALPEILLRMEIARLIKPLPGNHYVIAKR